MGTRTVLHTWHLSTSVGKCGIPSFSQSRNFHAKVWEPTQKVWQIDFQKQDPIDGCPEKCRNSPKLRGSRSPKTKFHEIPSKKGGNSTKCVGNVWETVEFHTRSVRIMCGNHPGGKVWEFPMYGPSTPTPDECLTSAAPPDRHVNSTWPTHVRHVTDVICDACRAPC